MKKIVAVILFSINTLSMLAQKASIVGNVKSIEGDVLIGANITINGTVRGAQTNNNGFYTIEALKAGIYTISMTYIGFEKIEKSILIKENEKIALNFDAKEMHQNLNAISVRANKGVGGLEHLAEVDGFSINATKKNELVRLNKIDANLAMNNSRQIFGRVPGISVWESDGSGIQTSIGSRGLSPNRSWEFNTRMNGYDITPDPMGYPEAYYTPPMEVVEKIEIVRGASSLQYGPQFGGLLNYVLRKPDISTKFTIESQNTVGSNHLFSSFNYIGGTKGRISYTAYYQKRKGNGWRQNSAFDTDHAHVEMSVAASNRLKIGAEITYMDYISQQAGGLSDEQFKINPQQSNRGRNWFSAPWVIPSITVDYVVNNKTKLNLKTFGIIGERNSIGFVKAINVADDLKERQIDRDFYKNVGSELRLISDYTIGKFKNTLATGLRYFSGNTERKQVGTGNNGNDYSVDLMPNSLYKRDLTYQNNNFSAFVENVFNVSKKLLFTAGIRYENIASEASGRLNIVDGKEVMLTKLQSNRNFVIAGIGAEYHATAETEFYTNISQAYRPVLFSDLTPPANTDLIDQNLKDANGFNFDFGYRGKINKFLNFDIDYFLINYNNRIGTITKENENKVRYQYRTNIGNSISRGFEGYVEFDPLAALKISKMGNLSLFASIALIDAKYSDFKTTQILNGSIVEGNLTNKNIENAPRKINRYGITYSKKGLSVTWQMSDIGEAFADATNTIIPNSTATTGLIPAYKVQDLSATVKFLKHYNIKASINNMTNEKYFTRRAGGYPGPGILPSDGRTFNISFGAKI
jgi:Fe(3+) dicitrate transport protein